MPGRTLRVRIKMHAGEAWGCLDTWDNRSIDIVATTGGIQKEKFSFVDGHRVRLWRFWDNIHFKVPPKGSYDISDVPPTTVAPPVVVSPHGRRNR